MGSLLKLTLKHPGKVEYREKVMSVFPQFQESIIPGEKLVIATSGVVNLHKKDYRFIVESLDVGMWMPVDVNSAVDKVNKYLRDGACALQDKHFGKNKEKDSVGYIVCRESKKFGQCCVSNTGDECGFSVPNAIVRIVANNLQQEGYRFVAQSDEGVWEEVSL